MLGLAIPLFLLKGNCMLRWISKRRPTQIFDLKKNLWDATGGRFSKVKWLYANILEKCQYKSQFVRLLFSNTSVEGGMLILLIFGGMTLHCKPIFLSKEPLNLLPTIGDEDLISFLFIDF